MTIGSSRIPYRCFLKTVFTWSPRERLLRVARLVWWRGMLMQGGYTAKLSIGLRPSLFQFRREYEGWLLTVLCVRLHYQRSYGGAIV